MRFTLELQLGNMMPTQQILAGFHELLAVCVVNCVLSWFCNSTKSLHPALLRAGVKELGACMHAILSGPTAQLPVRRHVCKQAAGDSAYSAFPRVWRPETRISVVILSGLDGQLPVEKHVGRRAAGCQLIHLEDRAVITQVPCVLALHI